ncbi:MAG: DUF2163 domain-containing protein [Pseudomonadota bacterium]
MRTLPAPLAASLASGATTLARCWRLTRRDQVVLGFTDHDRDLSFEGITFQAASGLAASALDRTTGLRVGSHAISGALQAAAVTEADLAAGRYDGAEMVLWLVDWRDVSSRIKLATGHLGEIRRTGTAFEAEVLGLAEALNLASGRAYLRRCDARLGDGRCGVDASQPAFRGTGQVIAEEGPGRLIATGLESYESAWFAEGALLWTGGENLGTGGQVKSHSLGDGLARLELWRAPGAAVAPGDTFEVVAGCDKRAETCRAKFANFLNFRGFPHMPGDDFAAGYPSGGGHDGGSLLEG